MSIYSRPLPSIAMVLWLTASVCDAAELSPSDSALISDLKQKIEALQARLDRLDQELTSGNSFKVYTDQVVSRGGQFYVPNSGEFSENGSLLNATPEPLAAAGLEITGFMDAVYENDKSLQNGNDVHLNQVEVDLAKNINDRANASLGIIYADGVEIGTAVMGYAIIPESESARTLKSWSVAAGQFDAPFGEDVLSYPSNLRKSITVPSIVENTHNLWNDLGVQTNFDMSPAVLDLWLVRGFSLQSNAAVDEPEHELNASCGSRLNFELTNTLRVGGSTSLGWLPDGTMAMHMHGAHIVHTHGAWSTTAEAVSLYETLPDVSTDRRGLYLQTVRELGHFFALCRGDYVDGHDFEIHRSLSLGGGAYLGSGLECRCEYKLNQSTTNQAFLQMVATF